MGSTLSLRAVPSLNIIFYPISHIIYDATLMVIDLHQTYRRKYILIISQKEPEIGLYFVF